MLKLCVQCLLAFWNLWGQRRLAVLQTGPGCLCCSQTLRLTCFLQSMRVSLTKKHRPFKHHMPQLERWAQVSDDFSLDCLQRLSSQLIITLPSQILNIKGSKNHKLVTLSRNSEYKPVMSAGASAVTAFLHCFYHFTRIKGSYHIY